MSLQPAKIQPKVFLLRHLSLDICCLVFLVHRFFIPGMVASTFLFDLLLPSIFSISLNLYDQKDFSPSFINKSSIDAFIRISAEIFLSVHVSKCTFSSTMFIVSNVLASPSSSTKQYTTSSEPICLGSASNFVFIHQLQVFYHNFAIK